VTGAGAVSSAMPNIPHSDPASPGNSVQLRDSDFDSDEPLSEDDDDDDDGEDNKNALRKDRPRHNTPSKKRPKGKATTPASAKRCRSAGHLVASEMARCNDVAETEADLLKQFLTKSEKEKEPDFLKSALEIVQGDSFLQELGVRNLIPAIRLLKDATEAKVFVLLKPEHRQEFLQALLNEN
jgi:hypothetical protein